MVRRDQLGICLGGKPVTVQHASGDLWFIADHRGVNITAKLFPGIMRGHMPFVPRQVAEAMIKIKSMTDAELLELVRS